MTPAEVPDELVEKAADAMADAYDQITQDEISTMHQIEARAALAAVLPEAYAEAIEHVAKRISPNSGIGLADGATRGDVAVWLLEYADALRAKDGEPTT